MTCGGNYIGETAGVLGRVVGARKSTDFGQLPTVSRLPETTEPGTTVTAMEHRVVDRRNEPKRICVRLANRYDKGVPLNWVFCTGMMSDCSQSLGVGTMGHGEWIIWGEPLYAVSAGLRQLAPPNNPIFGRF
jgi:hypothetical protein